MIHVKDNYYIDADSNCFCAVKVVPYINKNGEHTTRRDVFGYFGSVTGALKAIITRMQREYVGDTQTELVEALEELKRLQNEIMKAMEGDT